MLIFKVNSSLNINVKSGVKGNRIQKKPKVCLKNFLKYHQVQLQRLNLIEQLDNENTQKKLVFFT